MTSASWAAARLCQDVANNVTVNVRQTAVNAIVAEGEPLMVDSQEVQNRGMQVVAVGFAFGSVEAELIALAVSGPGFDPRTDQPSDERTSVVVAAGRALRKGHAAKFAGPYDQRIG